MNATMAQYETLFDRHASNTILMRKDWPYSINTVFNVDATLITGWFNPFALPSGRNCSNSAVV